MKDTNELIRLTKQTRAMNQTEFCRDIKERQREKKPRNKGGTLAKQMDQFIGSLSP